MWCDSEGVGGVTSFKDKVWSCLPPMGPVFDGIDLNCKGIDMDCEGIDEGDAFAGT